MTISALRLSLAHTSSCSPCPRPSPMTVGVKRKFGKCLNLDSILSIEIHFFNTPNHWSSGAAGGPGPVPRPTHCSQRLDACGAVQAD
eukprot:755961-Hanusia_phi.AAC.11